MCTVTILPRSNAQAALRILCNRDELRRRPAALPPATFHHARAQVLRPVDPVSGGTWIAATSAGLVLVLLNVNPPHRGQRVQAGPSRGTIIPRITRAETLDECLEMCHGLMTEQFTPYRLIMLAAGQFAEVHWDGSRFDLTTRAPVTRPLLYTSSSLGDWVVEPPRRALFERRLLVDSTSAAQDDFHRHVWPNRHSLSVWMTRSDAMTVSQTLVELDEHRIAMSYRARLGDTQHLSPATRHSLPLQKVLCHGAA